MDLDQINQLTKIAYNKTAQKYHDHFKDEVAQKQYDRLLLDRFASMFRKGSLICDAGCGPSGHIGRYLSDKGHTVTGIDIADKCIDIAKSYNPDMQFEVMDMMSTRFPDGAFDGIVAFYSIIYTPKEYISKMFEEFKRILKEQGKLLVVVKKGTNQGIINDEWYEHNQVHFTHFMEDEITSYFSDNNFRLDSIDTRRPYDFEFNVDRIYAIGTKIR